MSIYIGIPRGVNEVLTKSEEEGKGKDSAKSKHDRYDGFLSKFVQ